MFNEKFSKQLFVHLHFDTMDIFLVENNKLIFYNCFVVKNENDLCIIFFVIEQFDLVLRILRYYF